MKIFDIHLDPEKIIIYLTYNLEFNKQYIVTISDLDADCVYYIWECGFNSKGQYVWAIPLPDRLVNFIKNNKNYFGFSVKVYNEQKRLLQFEELILNRNAPRLTHSFYSDPFDIVGHSYVDFFYGNLCDNIDFSGVVIDAGANVGFFSLYSKINGAKKIYSIDPDPLAFYYLKKNLGKFSEITLINKAVTSNDEGCIINIRPGGTVGTTETPADCDIFSGVVPTISVNSILKIEKEINLLKLDIEGSEFKVIENLSKENYNNINQLFIEFHADSKPIVNTLKNMGYKVEYRNSTENNTVGFIYAKK
jgi:FkbM family methyltransferase